MASTHDKGFIDKVNTIIAVHYQQSSFGVQQLADKLAISRSQLHRKLMAEAGVSASTIINEFRLKKALQLLQEGSMSVSEVAYEVGYASPSYFSTAFKKHYSLSPVKVRPESFLKTEVKKPYTPVNIAPDHLKSGTKAPTLLSRWRLFVSFSGVLLIAFGIWRFAQSTLTDTEVKRSMVISDKSIAVLPFRNYSNDPSLEAFCDGMTDDIISKLSNLSDFDRVISRTSSYKFKDMKVRVPEIAAELGVAYILEGNMQKEDEKFKVNVQLINAVADDHILADDFSGDWESGDIFEIQERITSLVADVMQVAISAQESEQLRKNITQSKAAYDLYLQARFHMYSGDEGSLENARQMLMEAIALDTTFAEAYSMVGFIWFSSGLGEGFKDQDLAWKEAKRFLTQAQILDPLLIDNELYLLQGYFYYDWDFELLEEFMHTKFFKYNYTRETAGILDYAIKTGRYQEALDAVNRSIEADPLDAVSYSFQARALWFLGKKNEAVAILERMDKLHKNDWFYLKEAAHNYFMMNEFEHSQRALQLVVERFADRSPILLWLRLFFEHLQDQDASAKLLEELHQGYRQGASGSPAWYIALYHLVILEDENVAMEWFDKSFERKEVAMLWLGKEPRLEPLRDTEWYQGMYRKIGFDQVTD